MAHCSDVLGARVAAAAVAAVDLNLAGRLLGVWGEEGIELLCSALSGSTRAERGSATSADRSLQPLLDLVVDGLAFAPHLLVRFRDLARLRS